MSRDFQIFGETMVQTVFGAHVPPSSGSSQVRSLGLAQQAIVWRPDFKYHDVKTDSYGPFVPADVLTFMGEAFVQLDLIHFDPDVLDLCVEQAQAGAGGVAAGAMGSAGTPMGAGLPLGASGNFYTGLVLLPSRTGALGQQPYHFPASYLAGPFMQYPVGTQASVVRLRWRAVPYTPLIVVSSGNQDVQPAGAVLWDRLSE